MKSLIFNDFIQIPGLSLSVNHTGYGADYPIHRHGFSEVVIVRRGFGTLQLEGEPHPIKEGDAFIIQAEQDHGYEKSGDMELTNILYDEATCLPPDGDLRSLPGYHALFTLEPYYRPNHRLTSCLHCSRKALARVEHMIGDMDSELCAPKPGSATLITAYFRALVVFLCREYDGKRNKPSRSLMRLAEVVSWMEAHCHEALTIEDLLIQAHMARSTFHRVFEAVYKRSPMAHLIALRIEQAQAHLRTTDLSVADIALRCGFSDGNYLTRQFKKRTGLTPREYRSQFMA